MPHDNEIYIDLETTGLDRALDGVCSIGAVHDAKGEFYMECRPMMRRAPNAKALEVNGFTLERLMDKTLPSESEALHAFRVWLEAPLGGSTPDKFVFVGKNPSFDWGFLSREDGLEFPIRRRLIDVHSEAHVFAFVEGECVENPEYSIYDYYERIGIKPEPSPHNALEGAKHARGIHRVLIARLATIREKAARLDEMPAASPR